MLSTRSTFVERFELRRRSLGSVAGTLTSFAIQQRQFSQHRVSRWNRSPMFSDTTAPGTGRTNVYALLNSGQLRSVKIGGRRLIPRTAIDDFVKALED